VSFARGGGRGVTDETRPPSTGEDGIDVFLSFEKMVKQLKLKLCTNAGGIAAVWATRAAIRAVINDMARDRVTLEECHCVADHFEEQDDRYILSDEFEECFGKFGNKHVIINFRIEYHHDRPTNLYPIAESSVTHIAIDERTTEYCTSDEV
jgi:hypothetical protein